jgi:cytokinin riboside 5'-monophosphate phosphoribohydrolase
MPGGVGSMDELLEVMVSNHLGEINKPIGILNINGYYDSFMDWLQHAVDEQFVSAENQQRVLISSDPAELLEMILIAEMPDPDSWFERLNTDPTPS